MPMPDFIALDVQPEAETPARDIRIELKRGSATAVVHWPVESA
nr:transposase IS3/IS911 family protein [Diaphorobacter sp.]